MTDASTALLQETVRALLADACPDDTVRASEQGTWPERLWRSLVGSGLALVGVVESCGGSGGSIHDLSVVLRSAGRGAAPVPLVENWLAAWLRAAVALPSGPGPSTVACGRGAPTDDGFRLRGVAEGVGWLLEADEIVVLATGDDGQHYVVTGRAPTEASSRARNLAGEPRDRVDLSAIAVGNVVAAPASLDISELRLRGAYARAAMSVGALDRVRELTVRYAAEREQFGRPVARFQAVAQMMAVLEAEVEAAAAATALATDALAAAGEAHHAAAEIQVAKIRTARASRVASGIAHQVHGAIGWTYEHPLHLVTRRVLAWRDEFGSEREWAVRLGATLVPSGGRSAWERLVPA